MHDLVVLIEIKNITVMKKLIFITFAALALLSCQPNHITEVVLPEVWERDFRVSRNQWQSAVDEMGNHYFWHEERVPALNSEVFTYGQLQAFFVTARGALSPLPFSEFFEDDNGNRWGELFTIEFEERLITFIRRADDLASELPVRPFYDFNVRFLW
jgi:hypothetical protein